MVGTGHTSREFTDGQSLASTGRWPPGSRVGQLPPSFLDFSRIRCPPELLLRLALGRIAANPFDPALITGLKSETISVREEHGLLVTREADDRSDVPIDYRYLDLLLRFRRPRSWSGWLCRWSQGRSGSSAPPSPSTLLPKEEMAPTATDGSSGLFGKLGRRRGSMAPELFLY